MLPALSLAIIAPTGREQMPMGMVLAVAPRRVEHHDVATPERLASDGAIEVIQCTSDYLSERPVAHFAQWVTVAL
jgi:hypothetical protein